MYSIKLKAEKSPNLEKEGYLGTEGFQNTKQNNIRKEPFKTCNR
jgi:hypothetical protein